VISVHAILILAWREIWTTLRYPAFWLAVLGLPAIMVGLAWMMNMAEEATLPFIDKPPVVVIDTTGVLADAVEDRLGTRRRTVEIRPVDDLGAARKDVRQGEVAAVILLGPDTISSGRVIVEGIEPPSERTTRAIADAVLLAVVPHLPDGGAEGLARLTGDEPLIHVALQDTRDQEAAMADTLTAVSLGSGMLLLLPVALFGSLMAQGMSRDRTSGFSTLLVCATRAENALAGQLVGGICLGFLQAAVMSGSLALFALIVVVTRSRRSPAADAAVASEEIWLDPIEDALSTLNLELSVADLGLPILVYVILGVLGTLSYVAWAMAATVGASSNEEETDAVKQARALATLGLVYPSMLLSYLALLDPAGSLAAWGQLIPMMFAIMVWGRYLHGVADLGSAVAVIGHVVVSLALIRIVARSFVTGETIWELFQRKWTHWRTGDR
jgi:hypothetical protein